MTAKKNAINISITMIALSLFVILLCWCGRDKGVAELFYVLSSGVFGSSFATLWIFIYEYNKEKRELLSSIFSAVTSIFDHETLPVLERFGFYDWEIKGYMKGKAYMPPVPADVAARMSKQERCVYELCRFVDDVLDIGYDKIEHIRSLVESVDFWSDDFRGDSKYRDAIMRHISFPLYDVFIRASAMENGYIFRYFKGFKIKCEYSADEIYDFVCELDKSMHGTGDEMKYPWQKRNFNLRIHMYEKMWIFADAFIPRGLSHERRCEAKQAFLNDIPYKYVR